MKVQPLYDRILIEVLEAKEKTKGGIIIPETAKEEPQEAKVIAVGKGKVTKDGKVLPLEVKVGDKILCPKYASSKEKIIADDKEYLFIKEEDVLAIVK